MTSSAPSSLRTRNREPRLPPLFARETQLFGWQGLSALLPANWSLTSFSGDYAAGKLRIDDEEVPRLELRWEQPRHEIDLDSSIKQFLDALQRDAGKRGETFELIAKPRPARRSRPHQADIVPFGWIGEKEAVVGQGWGVVWKCSECGRVVVAHVMGRRRENRDAVEALAGDIFESLECHGTGGWETWSLFGLRLELPLEFKLSRAKLMTGRLELDWARPKPAGLRGLLRRDETLSLTRVSLANLLLENETLQEWTATKLVRGMKRWLFSRYEETAVRGHRALRSEGILRDLRAHVRTLALDLVRRQRSPRASLLVWHCEQSNKIFAFVSDLTPANAHVAADVLDSLQCHS